MTEMSFREFRLRCPYGKWTCPDGREVLFNRQYWPILERRRGEKAKPADPNERIPWIEQEYYFDDGNSPWLRRRPSIAAQALARCNRVLAEWGFSALPKPSPLKAFSDLRDEPRVNPYAEALPASDTHRAFAEIHRRRQSHRMTMCHASGVAGKSTASHVFRYPRQGPVRRFTRLSRCDHKPR